MAKKTQYDSASLIASFKRVHGETFDYSQVEFEGTASKVTIICRIHGPFEQQPRLHLRGSTGCRKCIALRGK